MMFKLELFIVMFAFASCFAQDITFQEDESPEDGSNNRVGFENQRPPWLARPRPGGNNFGSSSGFQPGRLPQNSNQVFNPNNQFPQNSNQGFNSNNQFPQNSNQGFIPNPPQSSESNSQATRPTQGGLRPPPQSSQKIISIVPCTCPFTPEYSPVCGSDSQTYLNAAVLNCFRVCGFDVTVSRGSACAQTAGRTRISK